MGRRGARNFEERIGEEKVRQLLERLPVKEMARLHCNHFFEDEEKARCKACVRSIYRAKNRLEEKERAEKTFDPIDTFAAIPEVQHFIDFENAKGKKSVGREVLKLRTMWRWIREPSEKPEIERARLDLVQLQRPALWDERHFRFFIQKLQAKGISQYVWKEALRRFFEAQGDLQLKEHPLIGASRKDLRSPHGARRKETEFETSLVPKIWECLDEEERLSVDLHITVKSREGNSGKGSLLNAQWKDINWEDDYYGFSMATIDIFEPKTRGGTWWRHCPIDLWFSDLSKRLRAKWERLGCPKVGLILNFDYQEYLHVWQKISGKLGRKLEPHDCRRSCGSWLRDLGLSELALGHYDPTRGEAVGYAGVGWENSEIYFQRYGKMNPRGIYNKRLKLGAQIFNGLINKIIENR